MRVGGDINAYQNCLVQFKDAWKHSQKASPPAPTPAPPPVAEAGQSELDSILEEIQNAYLSGRWTSRRAQIVKSN